MLPRTRYEAVVIAYICGCSPTRDEMNRLNHILMSDKNLFIKPHDNDELNRYLRYLEKLDTLRIVDGRYVIDCDELTRPMRIVVKGLYPKVVRALAGYGFDTSNCKDEI